MLRFVRICALVALGAAAAFAQVDAGTITGTVRDASGAVIPAATVIVESVETGARFEVATGAQGIYVSPPLRPGEFTVEVRTEGFEPAAKRFELEVNQRAVVDFQLNVGAVTEVVEVVDVVPLLQTETATLSNLRTEKAIKDLPLNGRNWAQLILLGAGAQPQDTQSQGSPITRKRGVSNASVNGSRGNDNNYLIEGISNSENHNGLGILIFPSIDAVKEFRSETSGADAQFGRGGGATVNLTYKSGTKEFHGGAYEFLRNAKLDAKNFFDRADEPIPPFKQNQYGAFLGGPLDPRSDPSTFFFVNFEGQRVRQAQTLISSVPTAAFRSGDFSQSRFAIFDPTTQRQVDGGFVRDPFPNNVIPVGMQDVVGQNVLNIYPLPNLNDDEANNYLGNPVRTINGEKFDIKIDHIFSDKNNMFGRFSYSDDDLVEPSFLPAPAVGAGPGVPGPADQPVHQVVLSDTHLITPTIVNEFRAGWTRLNLRSFNPNFGRNVSDEIGIPGSNVAGDELTSGLAIIQVGGFRSLGGNGFSPAVIVSDNYQFSDTVSVVTGRHSIKFGGEYRRLRYNALQSNVLRGNMNFNGNYTVDPASRAGTGLGPADAILGKPISGVIRFVTGTRGYRRTEVGFFLQDTYKATDKLTLNLGVRYDNFLGWPWTEVNDRQYNFIRSEGTVVQVGTGAVPWRSGHPGDNNNFSPRVGIAYKLTPNTVFRAGYGLYYSTGQLDTTRNLGANPPEFISSNFNNNQFDFAGARPASMGFERPAQGVVAGNVARRRSRYRHSLYPAVERHDSTAGRPDVIDRRLRREQGHETPGPNRYQPASARHGTGCRAPRLSRFRRNPHDPEPLRLQLPQPPAQCRTPIPRRPRVLGQLHLEQGHRQSRLPVREPHRHPQYPPGPRPQRLQCAAAAGHQLHVRPTVQVSKQGLESRRRRLANQRNPVALRRFPHERDVAKHAQLLLDLRRSPWRWPSVRKPTNPPTILRCRRLRPARTADVWQRRTQHPIWTGNEESGLLRVQGVLLQRRRTAAPTVPRGILQPDEHSAVQQPDNQHWQRQRGPNPLSGVHHNLAADSAAYSVRLEVLLLIGKLPVENS